MQVLTDPTAIEAHRLFTLAVALELYSRTKIRPNRTLTPTLMLELAGKATGKTYKRTQYIQAAQDLRAKSLAMRAEVAA